MIVHMTVALSSDMYRPRDEGKDTLRTRVTGVIDDIILRFSDPDVHLRIYIGKLHPSSAS